MTQENAQKDTKNGATETQAALETVRAMVDSAKAQIRDTSKALSEVSDSVKQAMREHKAQSADLEKARTTLQKLQAINL